MGMAGKVMIEYLRGERITKADLPKDINTCNDRK